MLRLVTLFGVLAAARSFAPLQPRPLAIRHGSTAAKQLPNVANLSPIGSLPRQSAVVVRAAENEATGGGFSLPWWLDPGTKGGAIVVCSLLAIIPIVGYYGLIAVGYDEQAAGAVSAGSFTLLAILLWTFSYMFRVANKDMTYAKQLKTYEDAVIAKRLEELADDEVNALLDEIDRDEELGI
mmetsp:Transcript_36438/g.97378  ORF Transcript_36438/g.97378 Transcript_36438/m.97378 type:complete len:182 (+) Transcript_36438:33-578(+)